MKDSMRKRWTGSIYCKHKAEITNLPFITPLPEVICNSFAVTLNELV